MSKYEPLTAYLRGQRRTSIPMTFQEIERVIGARLPPSASDHRAWWSNNPANNVMTRAWLKAGYRTASVDMDGRRLVFRKSGQAGPLPEGGGKEPVHGRSSDKADPDSFLRISDTLKGTVTVSPGVDLTLPVGERWEVEG